MLCGKLKSMSTKLSSYLCIRCTVWLGWAVIYGWSAAFTVSRTTVISHPDMPPITAFSSKCPSRALGLNRINTWDYLESPDSLYLGLFNLRPHSMDSFWHHFALNEVCPSVHMWIYVCVPVFLCVCVCVCVSMKVCLSVCISVEP